MIRLLLPLAPAPCPAGWTASPNASWANQCLGVPAGNSSSLRSCVELCGAEGGVPACIGSEEENAFAAELVGGDWAWLGLYQNDTSSVTSRRALLVPVAMRSEWGAKVAIAATHEHTMTGATHGLLLSEGH